MKCYFYILYINSFILSKCLSLCLYLLLADKYRWMLMKFKGAEPPKRLDHSMCIFPWTVCDDGTREEEDAYRPAHPEGIKLLFVFGGMDTQGTIYNDCIVTVVK